MTSQPRATRNGFLLSAAVVLALTGLAKVWSGFGGAKILAVTDPLLGLRFNHLMIFIGLLELVIALFCLFSDKWPGVGSGLVAWLATTFLIYRFDLRWIGYRGSCRCLGNLTDALHISPQTADTAMKIILGYLLVGSYGALFWLWSEKRKSRPAAEKIATSRETEQQI